MNNIMDHITSYFTKNKDSNNYKFYQLLDSSYKRIEKIIQEIYLIQNIDRAYGKHLDILGAMVGQERISKDDELYRLYIKTRIISNLSKGDIPTIKQVAKTLFPESFVNVSETWDKDEYGNKSATVIIHLRNTFNIPDELTMKRVIAGGVGLGWAIEFEPETDDIGKIFGGAGYILSEMITVYPYAIEDIDDDEQLFTGLTLGSITEIIEVAYEGGKLDG